MLATIYLITGFVLIAIGLKLARITTLASKVRKSGTYSRSLEHLQSSGASKAHGMHRSKEGKIVADSRASNRHLESIL